MPAAQSLSVVRLTEERSLVVTRATHLATLATTGDVLKARFVADRPDDPLLAAFLRAHFPALDRRRVRPHFAVNDHKATVEALLRFEVFAVMRVHSVAGFLESGTLRNASEFEMTSRIWLARPTKERTTVITGAFQAAMVV